VLHVATANDAIVGAATYCSRSNPATTTRSTPQPP